MQVGTTMRTIMDQTGGQQLKTYWPEQRCGRIMCTRTSYICSRKSTVHLLKIIERTKKIRQNISDIKGETTHEAFNTREEERRNHLESLNALHQSATTENADEQRRKDIARMTEEIKWIEDETMELRNKITQKWDGYGTELTIAEEKFNQCKTPAYFGRNPGRGISRFYSNA